MPQWCLVIVGDRKGPKEYVVGNSNGGAIFLDFHDQERLHREHPTLFSLAKSLPWNHFGRKNFGYLYAIAHGATMVWDFDDDNDLIKNHFDASLISLGSSSGSGSTSGGGGGGGNSNSNGISNGAHGAASVVIVEPANYPHTYFNPYPVMGAPSSPCWPRGYPLEHIKDVNHSTVLSSMTKIDLAEREVVGIVQTLANHDPDVDAIYRLLQPLPFSFPSRGPLVAVPRSAMAPYNAQATMHYYSALWSLLLPVTVHGRVSDIWRSYLAQRIGADIGMRIAFAPARVNQFRNVHNYMADFDSEEHLYKRSNRLIAQLREWKSARPTLPGRIEELWVFMFEHGYLEEKDVFAVQEWLSDLISIGYKFPDILPHRR